MVTPAKTELKYLSLLWATQEHAADIARVHASLFATPWDEAAVGRLLAHPGSIALLAGAGAPRAIGAFALAQVAADEAEILSLGVAEPWQRQGVATKLLDGIKRAAVRAGALSLFLEVAQSNAAALGLYGRNGFAETGRRAGYYAKADGTREDAVLLKCVLAT